MARTKINSLDIEDLSISAEDIADGSITDDKILSVDSSKLTGTIAVEGLPEITDSDIGTASITGNSILSVDVSKLIGVIDDARFSSPLPILDGTALTNVQASIIPDNFITIEKLNTPNSGTQGQLLSIDSSALTFSNSPISLEEQSVTQNKFSSTGTFPAWDGSNLINVPPAGPNVSNEAVGGDFNGTVGSMSINNDVITDAKITELDASKITGTLPASINDAALESVGELGFLNKTAWADNELVSITLDNSALSIGKVVTKVYEETALGVQPGLTNENISINGSNEQGFELQEHSESLITLGTVTPSATTGQGVIFSFTDWGNPFQTGAGNNAHGMKIINKTGPGIAKIIPHPSNSNVSGYPNSYLDVLCDIIEDFPSTAPLTGYDEWTLVSGEFTSQGFGLAPFRNINNSDIDEWTTQEHTVVFSSSDTIDTTGFSTINSLTAQVTNYQPGSTMWFCFATDITQDVNGNVTGGTYFMRNSTYPAGVWKDIVSSRSAIHGGTEGDWYYQTKDVNENVSTGWVKSESGGIRGHNVALYGSDHNSIFGNNKHAALYRALKINDNKMLKEDVAAVTAGVFPLGDKLALGIGTTGTLFGGPSTPYFEKLIINYDGDGIVDVDKTHEYTIDIVNLDTIEVTAPSSGGPRNSKVYITT